MRLKEPMKIRRRPGREETMKAITCWHDRGLAAGCAQRLQHDSRCGNEPLDISLRRTNITFRQPLLCVRAGIQRLLQPAAVRRQLPISMADLASGGADSVSFQLRSL